MWSVRGESLEIKEKINIGVLESEIKWAFTTLRASWMQFTVGYSGIKTAPLSLKWEWKSLSRVHLCDPVDWRVHGILQDGILEWVAFLFSRGSSQPMNQTGVSCIAGRFLTNWAIRESRFCLVDTNKNQIQKIYFNMRKESKSGYMYLLNWFTLLYTWN